MTLLGEENTTGVNISIFSCTNVREEFLKFSHLGKSSLQSFTNCEVFTKWYKMISITIRLLNNIVEKLEKFEKSAQFCNEFSESSRKLAFW